MQGADRIHEATCLFFRLREEYPQGSRIAFVAAKEMSSGFTSTPESKGFSTFQNSPADGRFEAFFVFTGHVRKQQLNDVGVAFFTKSPGKIWPRLLRQSASFNEKFHHFKVTV